RAPRPLHSFPTRRSSDLPRPLRDATHRSAFLTDLRLMRTQRSAIGPIPVPTAGDRVSGLFTFASDEGLAKYTWPYIAIAGRVSGDRKSTRLNSSHVSISY